ncbi:hypothetical protein RUND412_005883 [Rhizina undulata]
MLASSVHSYWAGMPASPGRDPFSISPGSVARNKAQNGAFDLHQRRGHLPKRAIFVTGTWLPVKPEEQKVHNLSPIPGPVLEDEEETVPQRQADVRDAKRAEENRVLRRSKRVAERLKWAEISGGGKQVVKKKVGIAEGPGKKGMGKKATAKKRTGRKGAGKK